jgi:hypothetical protein
MTDTDVKPTLGLIERKAQAAAVKRYPARLPYNAAFERAMRDRAAYAEGYVAAARLYARIALRWFQHRTRPAATPATREAVARPEVVVLCGSTRFYDEFQQANYDLTMDGKIVLSVGFYPHAKAKHGHGEGVGHDSAEKVALDELHKRKIDLADRVLVLNVGGYIGESTRGEIDYAERLRRPIDYLEPLDIRERSE